MNRAEETLAAMELHAARVQDAARRAFGGEEERERAPGLLRRMFEKLVLGFAEGCGIVLALLACAYVVAWVLR